MDISVYLSISQLLINGSGARPERACTPSSPVQQLRSYTQQAACCGCSGGSCVRDRAILNRTNINILYSEAPTPVIRNQENATRAGRLPAAARCNTPAH